MHADGAHGVVDAQPELDPEMEAMGGHQSFDIIIERVSERVGEDLPREEFLDVESIVLVVTGVIVVIVLVVLVVVGVVVVVVVTILEQPGQLFTFTRPVYFWLSCCVMLLLHPSASKNPSTQGAGRWSGGR